MRTGVCTIIGALIILKGGGMLGIPGGVLTLGVVLAGILITRGFFVADKNKKAA